MEEIAIRYACSSPSASRQIASTLTPAVVIEPVACSPGRYPKPASSTSRRFLEEPAFSQNPSVPSISASQGCGGGSAPRFEASRRASAA